ncbi:MAG: 4Fe-4S cluster-binding domain-containing protein [Phycisphaerae bacterium]|nr:4Fe-4S cluster-binding domain-containing protein [Phycisphaerae bacterium]
MHKGDHNITLAALRNQKGHVHQQMGDLNRLDAVVMNGDFATRSSFQDWSPYMVHLSVTGRCNARCAGCINDCITFRDDTEHRHLSKEFDIQPARDAQAVSELLEKDNTNEAVVCFYGGEPLLMPGLIADTIERLEAKCPRTRLHYMLYTNGLLLDKTAEAFESLLSKFWLVSVSIDGRAEQHNRIRAGADLQTIHENLRAVRPNLCGSVLMWSTLRESQSLQDCFEEFLDLESQGLVSHWFWHWIEAEEPFDDLAAYCQKYERDLRYILDAYIERLAAGKPLSIIHLDELILYLLTATRRGTTGCGVEENRNFDLVGGRILACADLGMEWELGRVDEQGHPHLQTQDLGKLIDYKKHLGCYYCGVHAYCGGRCPVEAVTSTPQRLVEYCQLMRLHVGVVLQYMPQIKAELLRHNISPQQFYDRSAKFAQFTDVTP